MKKFSLIILCLFLSFGCSNDDDTETEVVQKSNNFEAAKSNVAPLEIVQIISKNALSDETYSAKLNGIQLDLAKLNDTTLVFMVPKELSNEKGNLSFLVGGKLEELEFDISDLELVTDPDSEIQEIIMTLNKEILGNIENANLQELLEVFQENLSAFNSGYEPLSKEDKILSASFIKINFTFSEDELITIKSQQEFCFEQKSLKYLANKKKAVAGIVLMTGAVMVPEPAISKVAALFGAGLFVGYVYATTDAVEKLVGCINLKDFFSLESIQKSNDEIYRYENNKEYILNVFGKYDGLSKQDLNGENSFLKSTAESIDEFKELLLKFKKHYNSFVNYLNLPKSLSLNVPEMLPPNPVASEIKQIEPTKISQIVVMTDKAAIKSNGMEDSNYILGFSNNTIEDQVFDIKISGEDEGFLATSSFKIELEASSGKIDVMDGKEKTVNDENEASVFLTVRNEDDKPVENAIIELVTANSHVSFLPANTFTTGANGVVSFKVKISEENTYSSVYFRIILKNQAGEVVEETGIDVYVDLKSRLINNSPWKLTSYVVGGWDHFTYMNLGNESCYPDGVFDQQKMLNATYQFNEGSANMGAVMEIIRFDCETGSFLKTQFADSSGHNWKIDENTGKFVVIKNNIEVAWLTVQVSESGIYMNGPHIMENGEEKTWSMRLEKQ